MAYVLQATEKARALLGKKRHKTQNMQAMDWKDVLAFYAPRMLEYSNLLEHCYYFFIKGHTFDRLMR
ncbi:MULTISPECIES: hypothetical protein [unclassified Bartonella]|uniref:hypothetical protein n=1 Tax=unclassified Bartonella TaxID=2645622 RepID=UPI0035CF11F0